jgi:hypothetical protein
VKRAADSRTYPFYKTYLTGPMGSPNAAAETA